MQVPSQQACPGWHSPAVSQGRQPAEPQTWPGGQPWTPVFEVTPGMHAPASNADSKETGRQPAPAEIDNPRSKSLLMVRLRLRPRKRAWSPPVRL